MKNRILSIALLLTTMVLTGCEKDELMLYNAGDRACFWKHAQSYSFYGKTEAEMPKGTIEIPINLMGDLADHDRIVAGEAYIDPAGTPEKDKKTTAPANAYKVLGGVIPANSVEGKFYVEVSNLDEFAETELKLRAMIVKSDEIEVGLLENDYIDLTWSRKLVEPNTWKAMKLYTCATYSTMVYKIWIEVTGYTECYYSTAGIPDPETGAYWADLKCLVYGKKFSDYCYKYKMEHGHFPLHDDGDLVGQPIQPVIQSLN